LKTYVYLVLSFLILRALTKSSMKKILPNIISLMKFRMLKTGNGISGCLPTVGKRFLSPFERINAKHGVGSKLTGRHLRYELLPFSYNEFLLFSNKKPGTASFDDYLASGGFPEYLPTKNIQILQELFTDIISRDIIVRFNLRNPKLVKDIALYLISNIGKEFSYTGLAKLHNLGSKNTLISLVGYLEDSFMLFSAPRFEFSIKKQIIALKKFMQ